MNYTIDLKNRRIVFDATGLSLDSNNVFINEFDKLTKKFLPDTSDTYECELVLLEVDLLNDKEEIVGTETKAFVRRIGRVDWLMEFNTNEYSKIV